MKKLNAAIDRFVYKHPNFGIPNLMKYIVIGNVLVYLLTVFSNAGAVQFLAFNWKAILHGEVWRLVTFLFFPGYTSLRDAIWLLFFLYLYYMIGTTLEREWGTAKFSLYYFIGVFLTILTGVLSGLVLGNAAMAGADFINLSMFFAFAVLYPDTQFLLFFIIPVKVKWFAWIDAAFFAISILVNLFSMNWLGALLPIVAILNFFIFFWDRIMSEISYRRGVSKRQSSHQTIQFQTAARRQRQKEAKQGYRHKCAVCGRTDTDYPDLQFRYCSRCAGYHCFCEDHIFTHEHFTE